MDIQRIDSNDRSSGVSVYNGVAYFAGVPDRPYRYGDTAAEQFAQTLANVEKRLAKVGSTKSDVIFVQIFIAHPSYAEEINAVWDKWIDRESPPSRCCKGAIFQQPAMKVEVVVTAAARNTRS